MTALASYSTGTVSVADGGTIVTNTGAIWSGTNARPGDILQIDEFQTIIADVDADAGKLTVPPWGGGAQTDVAYTIWQVSPQRFAGAEAMGLVNRLVAALEADGFIWFVDADLTEPDPSVGDEGQFAQQPSTGKTWVKDGGVWDYLGVYKAFRFTGAYNNLTTYSVGDVMTSAGSSYVWINETPGAGHSAPNTTYWQLLASKGDQGTTGPTGAGYGGTSTTSLTIGAGSKAFATQAGRAYTNGARVRASSAANTSNWMEGLATYSGTTLTINVDKTNGSGTLADWNFNLVGQPGAGDLSSANNLSDLANAATARANLGAAGRTRTRTVLTSGSGTYNLPAGCLAINVRMAGGGGGGGGSGTSAGNGGTGGNSTFGSSFLTCNGGAGGQGASAGGAGGGATGGDFNLTGGPGRGGSGFTNGPGGDGGNGSLGGAGQGGRSGGEVGVAAAVNSGAGGGGASSGTAVNAGGGGGAGGYLEKLIASPSSSYAYAVGAAGTAGTAGTSGLAGGAGGSGHVIIDEYY